MQMPKTGQELIDFMSIVWEGDLESLPDGSAIAHGSTFYNEYHDARLTALRCNAKKLWSSHADDGYTYIYEMPNGDRVAIGTDGNSIRAVNKHLVLR